ncbi:universal stress protein [Streptomyces sp. 769]|uniref:universal stress protein n=1 Tax=Streptomyces sp. 769 TaxID=1262452 RepID=UPI00068B5662|nr:universal stress protein [Streptomyces sp. 769]
MMNTTNAVRRVVVGVNGSVGSSRALRRAADEARRHHAQLCPVMIYSSPQGDYIDMLWPPDAETEHELASDARHRLAGICHRVLDEQGDDPCCAPVVARGPVGPLLVQAADHDGDLLVIGGGSRGMLSRLISGSVGRYCVRHAEGPVLVVPDEESADEASAAA